jgi:hypothetical protein
MSLVLSNEATLDYCCSTRSFTKCDFGNDVAFLDDLTTVIADRSSLVGIADVWVIATFWSFGFRGSHRCWLRFPFCFGGLVDVPGTRRLRRVDRAEAWCLGPRDCGRHFEDISVFFQCKTAR